MNIRLTDTQVSGKALAHIIHGWQLARRASEWYAPRSLACASC